MDVHQPGVVEEPVIVKGRNLDSLSAQGRNEGVDFFLKNNGLPQVQSIAASVQIFKGEKGRNGQNGAGWPILNERTKIASYSRYRANSVDNLGRAS